MARRDSLLAALKLEHRGRGRGRGQNNLSVRRWAEMGIKNWLNKVGQLPFIGLALALISSTLIDGCLAPRRRLNGSPRFVLAALELECRGRGQNNLSARRWDEMGIKNWLNKVGQLLFFGLALALISSTRIDGCLAPRCRLNGSPRFAFGSFPDCWQSWVSQATFARPGGQS